MPTMAQTERTALCDTALRVGEDQPTLCEGWTVKDLVVHLLVREGSPAAVGIALAPLAGWTDRVSRKMGRADFDVLVERLRGGPPRLSAFATPRLDALLNTLEFFVHHEDIRRAQPDWEPRHLPDKDEDKLWRATTATGKRIIAGAKGGVTIEDSRSGTRAVLRQGNDPLVVRGLPSEVTVYVFGREPQARVELDREQR